MKQMYTLDVRRDSELVFDYIEDYYLRVELGIMQDDAYTI